MVDLALTDMHRRLLLRKMGASVELTSVINVVFDTVTTYIHPRFSAFAALTAVIGAFKRKDFGIFSDYGAVFLPTAVLDPVHCVQYRTGIMQTVYAALVPVCMSEITMRSLRIVLQPYDLQILFFCNGSFLFGEEKCIRAFSGSLEHVRREKMYSEADTHGYPIQIAGSFSRMPDSNTDLRAKGAEARLFQDIERMFHMSL